MLRITASPAVALGILVMNAGRLPDQSSCATARVTLRGGYPLRHGICPQI